MRVIATPIVPGPAVTSEWANISPPPRMGQSLGLAREESFECTQSSTGSYKHYLTWRVFEDWCTRNGVIPFQCAVSDILIY